MQLFYGPVEPTWIVHPHYPGFKRSNGYSNNYDPYTIYSDHAYTYRRNPYTQRNAVPSASAAQEGAALRPGQGVMHPYQTQYLAHGTNAANGANFSPMSPAPDTNLGGESQNQNLSQTRNVFGVQVRNLAAAVPEHEQSFCRIWIPMVLPLTCQRLTVFAWVPSW